MRIKETEQKYPRDITVEVTSSKEEKAIRACVDGIAPERQETPQSIIDSFEPKLRRTKRKVSKSTLNKYGKIFDESVKNKNEITRGEITRHMNHPGSNVRFVLDKIAIKRGFEIITSGGGPKKSGSVRYYKTKKSKEFIPPKREWSKPPITHKQVNTVVFSGTLPRQFSAHEVREAMNLDDSYYQNVYQYLEDMRRTNILNKYISKGINGGTRVQFEIQSRSDKKRFDLPKKPKIRIELPSDTTEEVLQRIFENLNDTFMPVSLEQCKNKYGEYYRKYSAIGLFKWMCRNKEYVGRIVGKNLAVGGTGDYLYIQVLD